MMNPGGECLVICLAELSAGPPHCCVDRGLPILSILSLQHSDILIKFSLVMFQRTVCPPLPHPAPDPPTTLPCLKPTRSVLCYNWGSSKTAAASSPTRTPSSNTLAGLLSCALIGPLAHAQTHRRRLKLPKSRG